MAALAGNARPPGHRGWRPAVALLALAVGSALHAADASVGRASVGISSSEPATVLAQVEVGSNDFRISQMGPDGSNEFLARRPAAAYNGLADEYLVAWAGEDDAPGLAFGGEFEIYVRRIDASTGQLVGGDHLRISDMGPDGTVSFAADSPAVAYNSTDNQYLVVWEGDDDTAPLVEGEKEIFGQLLDAGGSEIGTNDFRISDAGPDGVTGTFDARWADVAYNSTDNEYLVVWSANNDGDNEIWGQRLDAAGNEIGTNDFRISNTGPEDSFAFQAEVPAVAFNDAEDEFLVAWVGDNDAGGQVDDEFEVLGQRLDATGVEVADDFRVSDMGPDGDPGFDVVRGGSLGGIDVLHNPVENEYLVVWAGDDDTGTLVEGELEIFGQLLDPAGVEVGRNDFRISRAGPDGDTGFDAGAPAASYDRITNEYLVVFVAPEPIPPPGGDPEDAIEIWGRRLSALDGEGIGDGDSRISDMGPDQAFGFDAAQPAVAFGSGPLEHLVVWAGDDDTGTLVEGELEIFGQRLRPDFIDFWIGALLRTPSGPRPGQPARLPARSSAVR